MNLITKLFLAALLFLPAGLFAQNDTLNLTLEDAIVKALKGNTEIRISEMEVRKAESQVSEAYGYAMPTLNLSFGFNHYLKKPKMPFPDFGAQLTNAVYGIMYQEDVPIKDGPWTEELYKEKLIKPEDILSDAFFKSNSYDAKAEIVQILFNSAVIKGIGVSQVYSNMSRVMLNSKIASNISSVKKAFYGALLADQTLYITRQSLANAQDNLRNVKAMEEQGLVSEFDALQAEVRVENLKPVVTQMENIHKTALDGLKMIIGIDPTKPVKLTGEIKVDNYDVPKEDESISIAENNNFDIQTMKMKLELDDAMIDVEESDYWPTLMAFGNYSLSGTADDFNFLNYSSSIVGLNLQFNLFKGLQTENKVEQAEIAYQQSQEQLSQLKEALKMQIRSTLNEMTRVKDNIEAQKRNVKLAERASEIASLRYKEGTGTQLEIENSDLALRQARINLLQSIHAYIVAESELVRLTGSTDKKYLRAIPR